MRKLSVIPDIRIVLTSGKQDLPPYGGTDDDRISVAMTAVTGETDWVIPGSTESHPASGVIAIGIPPTVRCPKEPDP